MARKQVFKVAKEIGISSGELLQGLKGIGIEKKGNFSVLEGEEYELALELFGESRGDVETPEAEGAREASAETATQEAVREAKASAETLLTEPEEAVEEGEREPTGVPRPPVLAVLGHVDHGKTTLLDRIRKTRVAEGEAGGITQSIGAYRVQHEGRTITFIDTPGHRAFTGMRARGAQVTDIVILVVAADDGVMEQTREAIAHARAAEVPIVVAINKVDKAGADPERVKQQLAQEGLVPEDWGGDTIAVPISALDGDGIDELLEMILLVAELEELTANPDRPVQGVIIESHVDPFRGPLATAIVQDGTLRERDVVVAGTAQGRIRALLDDQGNRVEEVLPGSPVQILGLSEAPRVGITLERVDRSSEAKKIVERRQEEERRARFEGARRTWDDVLAQTARAGVLKLIVKADTLGAMEAVEGELKGLGEEAEEVDLEIVHTGVGNIGESDVLLAASSEEEVSVVGFRVGVDAKARDLAEQEQVTVRTYDVIYELADDVRTALRGLMEPRYEEVKLAEVEVRQTFRIPRVGTVAGCYVRDGQVRRNAHVRVIRDGSAVHEGRIESLKRFDQDVREVSKEKECGIKIAGFDEVEIGDRLEVYTLQEVERL